MHGDELVDRIAFHVALFQLNAVVQPAARRDRARRRTRGTLTPRSRRRCGARCFATCGRSGAGSTTCRRTTARAFVDPPGRAAAAPGARRPAGPVELLAFCGGGKDSLVALKLLERAELPFATLGYAHSIYGAAAPQHALLDRVGAATRARARRAPVGDRRLPRRAGRPPAPRARRASRSSPPRRRRRCSPRCRSRSRAAIAASSSPTRRARTRGNLEWNGEGVNHQWGKGWEAEQLLDGYVRRALARERALLQRAAADPRRGHLRAARARRRARAAHALVQRAASRGAARARSARTSGCSWRRTCRRPSSRRRSATTSASAPTTSAGSASCSGSPSTRRSSASAARRGAARARARAARGPLGRTARRGSPPRSGRSMSPRSPARSSASATRHGMPPARRGRA